jgi:hypothetical protein
MDLKIREGTLQVFVVDLQYSPLFSVSRQYPISIMSAKRLPGGVSLSEA